MSTLSFGRWSGWLADVNGCLAEVKKCLGTLSIQLGLAGLVLVALLTGCSTPAPIRDLAGQGAATAGLAEISLREYLALTNAQLAARMELVSQDAQRLANDRSRRELDALLDASAGIPVDDSTVRMILALGEGRRVIRERADRRPSIAGRLEDSREPSIAGRLGGDAAAAADKLSAAQKGFAVLSQELSAKEWLALFAGYANEITKGIEALKATEAPADGTD